MITSGSNDSSKIPDTTQSTPTAVATTAYPAPIITSTPDKKTFTNSIGMEFVLIPAGEFDMGSASNDVDRKPNEEPVHRVKLSSALYFGKYEVTQKQWYDVMGTSPSNYSGNDLPVEQVSWNDAQEFIKKLNEKEGINKYKLPSEAEWEYAARAGTKTRYSFGDSYSNLGDYAWYNDNSNSKTHQVGRNKPNEWGLYDMHGNVWEWVQDKWHDDYNGAPNDASSWERGDGLIRVGRGGGWSGSAGDCRSAARFDGEPDYRDYALGFRILRIL
ncbi:MAG: formylglycine-generating enzyme family protein [Candidatus Methanoperedens sp.]|nr:formylglycine-generating enzyme family protein [Candidatus Methanoperedens sp.]